MLEARDVQLAVALVDFAVAVFGAIAASRDALLRVFLALCRVKRRLLRHGQVGVLVDAEDLQSAHSRGLHVAAVRDALGVLKVSRRVVDDQVFGVDGLGDRTVAQRAIVNLLEARAAEAEHEQHAVGVGVILSRHRRQVVVEVALQRVGALVLLQVRIVVVIADLDGSVSRQQLGACIGLKSQHSLQQERMSDF